MVSVVADVVKSSGDIVETEEASVNVFKEYKKLVYSLNYLC